MKNAKPDVPNVGNDRATDNWTPLFAVADLCGGDWPELACKAIKSLEMTDDRDTIRQMLLSDVKMIFENRGMDRISSKVLAEDLIEIEDHPWADWRRGKSITQTGLARLLKPFGIRSKTIRFEMKTPKGYELQQFEDVFKRYLSHAFTPPPPIQSATPPQTAMEADHSRFQSATRINDVAVENPGKPAMVADCGGVADGKGSIGEDNAKSGKKSNQTELFPNEPQGNGDAAFL